MPKKRLRSLNPYMLNARIPTRVDEETVLEVIAEGGEVGKGGEEEGEGRGEEGGKEGGEKEDGKMEEEELWEDVKPAYASASHPLSDQIPKAERSRPNRYVSV